MKRTFALLSSLILIASTGCTYRSRAGSSDSGSSQAADAPSAISGSHWYYFSDSGIHAASSPKEIPARVFRPWTEAVRVADSAVISGEPALLINRLGIMTTGTGTEAPALHREASLFPANTAGGIYRSGDSTLIRLYRSRFFADGKADASLPATACLARYDGGSMTPFLSAPDFGLAASAQCVALDRIGSMWYASFKEESASRVDFTYLEFPSLPDKGNTEGIAGIKRISNETYQKSVSPFAFTDAPQGLVSLLAGIPADTAFSLRVHSRSGESSQTFIKDGEGTPVQGTAFVSGNGTAALFADGSFYFNPESSGGKITRLKLPTLSRGYVYTDFVLTGKKILAAWEEQRFFETGRAGLLEISIPDEVY